MNIFSLDAAVPPEFYIAEYLPWVLAVAFILSLIIGGVVHVIRKAKKKGSDDSADSPEKDEKG